MLRVADGTDLVPIFVDHVSTLLVNYLVTSHTYKKAPQARVGSQRLHRGEGVGEEEPRSDARSQVESEGSEPPPPFF
jgi:hypothetical protein